MFEKFTDRARRVVVLAQEEARMLGHGRIGTEHLLLGLAHEGEGVAAKALESAGVALPAAREKVAELVGRGDGPPSGHIPFTPRAKKTLELSLREADRLGHTHIGTEHLLLGLLAEGDGVGAQTLASLGVGLPRLREDVVALLHGQPSGDPRRAGPAEGQGPGPRAHAQAWSSGPRLPAEDLGPRLDVIAGSLGDLARRLDEVAGRLAAIERRLGAAGPETGGRDAG